ncbi:MAG: diacylglycerol kinase family protein [Chloroflexi bacterium]|jgi:diacylglycerol kinase|nr:diacylglycerol kinase family protein [Chloroflexota bacterium]
MKDFFISRIHSFGHAFSGMAYVLKTQKNAYIHTFATVIVVLVALWLQISNIQFAILILTIGTVWTAEFINTSLEAVVDLASPEKHPLAKVGKDVGAAAVLIAAMSSVIIGILILGPALLTKLGF